MYIIFEKPYNLGILKAKTGNVLEVLNTLGSELIEKEIARRLTDAEVRQYRAGNLPDELLTKSERKAKKTPKAKPKT